MTTSASTETPCPPELAQYFSQFLPFLRGEIDLSTYLQEAGPSESHVNGWNYYPTAAAKNPRDVLEAVFRATKVAADAHREGAFEALMRARFAEGRPWQLSGLVTGFGQVVASAAASGDVPAHCAELADYEELWLNLRTGPDGEHVPGFAPMLEVRRYTTNVVALFKAARGGDAASVQAVENVYVFYRHPQTRRARRHQPTMAQLLTLAVKSGDATVEAAVQSGVSEGELAAAEQELVARGVLVAS